MKTKPATRRGHYTNYLFLIPVTLVICHWITVGLTLNDAQAASSSWAVWFDLDREYNVPTLANAALLGSSAILSAFLIFKSVPRIQKLGWISFSVLFSYLALDEALIIHEQLAEPTRKLLDINNTNPLYHAWVVPAFFIVAVLALITVVITKYFKQLKIFADVLTYVVVLAGGVVLLEILGTFVYNNTAAYRLLMVPAEEIFEITMAVVVLSQLRLQSKIR